MPVLSVGGASRLMSEIIPRINQSQEYEVEFLINRCIDSSFMPKFEKAGIKVHELKSSRIYSPLNIFQIAKYIKGYDLIHANLFPTLYWTAIANIFSRRTLVYTEHSTSNSRRNKRYFRLIEKWVYKQYDKIISISDGTEKNLREWVQARNDDKRFVVINNGVDLAAFRKIKHESVYPQTLIMIGRFAPSKDQKTVIRAMPLLNDEVHLILVGDGELIGSCKELAREIRVSGRVHFVGTQADVPSWIGKADVGILSSHWEGFGLTAVEMMAGGLPVVACDIDGVKQVVDGAGVLFPHEDYKALAYILSKLLNDTAYYDDVKQKCKERCDKYDIKTMVESYIDVYKNLL